MRAGIKYSKAFLSVNIKALCCVSPIPDTQYQQLSQFQSKVLSCPNFNYS